MPRKAKSETPNLHPAKKPAKKKVTAPTEPAVKTQTNQLNKRRKDAGWRSLNMAQLKGALIKIGVEPEAAEEYTDDPNAMGKALRAKLNKYLTAGRNGENEIDPSNPSSEELETAGIDVESESAHGCGSGMHGEPTEAELDYAYGVHGGSKVGGPVTPPEINEPVLEMPEGEQGLPPTAPIATTPASTQTTPAGKPIAVTAGVPSPGVNGQPITPPVTLFLTSEGRCMSKVQWEEQKHPNWWARIGKGEICRFLEIPATPGWQPFAVRIDLAACRVPPGEIIYYGVGDLPVGFRFEQRDQRPVPPRPVALHDIGDGQWFRFGDGGSMTHGRMIGIHGPDAMVQVFEGDQDRTGRKIYLSVGAEVYRMDTPPVTALPSRNGKPTKDKPVPEPVEPLDRWGCRGTLAKVNAAITTEPKELDLVALVGEDANLAEWWIETLLETPVEGRPVLVATDDGKLFWQPPPPPTSLAELAAAAMQTS